MKVTVILIVISALGIVIKRLVQELEDLEIRRKVEIFQTIALLRSARILRKVPEICLLSDSSGKPSANAGVKNSQIRKITTIIITCKISKFIHIYKWYMHKKEFVPRE